MVSLVCLQIFGMWCKLKAQACNLHQKLQSVAKDTNTCLSYLDTHPVETNHFSMLKSCEHVAVPSNGDPSNDVVWTTSKDVDKKDAIVPHTHSNIRATCLDRGRSSSGMEMADTNEDFDRLFMFLTESELNTNEYQSIDKLHVSRSAPADEKEPPLRKTPRVSVCTRMEMVTLPPPAIFSRRRNKST